MNERLYHPDPAPGRGWRKMLDLHDDDRDGNPYAVKFKSCRPSDSQLEIFFADENREIKAKVAFCLVRGALEIDVIDYPKVEPDAVPCGAEAIATVRIQINPRRGL